MPSSWTASDDEALRSFDIQVSFDGGRYWTTIARDLPSDATSDDWNLPASEGIPEVRARVVARDLRFQNSADGDGRSFAILAGAAECTCLGDFDGDAGVTFADLVVFLDCLAQPGEGCACGDFDGDQSVTFGDLVSFLAALETGICG